MRKKVLLSVLIVIGTVVFGFLLLISGKLSFGVPSLLTSNFVDLNKIFEISKYRSCQGHVVVPQDRREERRNMKHYFRVKKEFFGENTVEIYAPYDGYVSVVRSEPEMSLQGEIWISQSMLPPFVIWSFSVEHINVKQGLKMGDKVRAGDLIGYAALSHGEADNASFDIIYGKIGLPLKNIDGWTSPFSDLDSVFNHMSEEVLAEYKEQGMVSKETMQYSKEERDQDLCEYNKDFKEGIYFKGDEYPEDWVRLK